MNENIDHPMLPNYTGPKAGLFGLVHHDLLAEWSDDITERVSYVRSKKPANEQDIRAKSMVYLDPTGQPWQRIYAERQCNYAERQRIDAEWQRIEAEWQRIYAARQRIYAERQCNYAERQRIDAERQRIYAEWQRNYDERQRIEAEWQPAIEAQIRALVPDLPWDGHQLVFRQDAGEMRTA